RRRRADAAGRGPAAGSGSTGSERNAATARSMIGPAWAPGTRTSAAAKADASRNSRFTDLAGRAPVFGRHEWIAVVGGRHERLLDRARAYPTDEVPQRACLVVRAGSACAAERLLADDRAGRLVIDVEVASRIAKLFVGEIDCVTVA